MFASTFRAVVGGVALAAALTLHAQVPSAPAKPRAMKIEAVTEDKFFGDFDKLLERRRIRVLVPYSRTLYFNCRTRSRTRTSSRCWASDCSNSSSSTTGKGSSGRRC